MCYSWYGTTQDALDLTSQNSRAINNTTRFQFHINIATNIFLKYFFWMKIRYTRSKFKCPHSLKQEYLIDIFINKNDYYYYYYDGYILNRIELISILL